jgi:hypothetical protein
MQMNIEIRGRPKALNKGHVPCLGLRMGQPGLFDQKGRDGPVDGLQHWREQVRMSGEQMLQWNGKRHQPLTDGHVGDDMIDKMGGRFRHAAGTTGGAKTSPFAGERHESVSGAGPAPQPEKSMGQDSAFQKRLELVFDKLGQAGPGL